VDGLSKGRPQSSVGFQPRLQPAARCKERNGLCRPLAKAAAGVVLGKTG